MSGASRLPGQARWGPRLLLLVVSSLVALAVAEIALRALAPLPDPYAWSTTPR